MRTDPNPSLAIARSMARPHQPATIRDASGIRLVGHRAPTRRVGGAS